MEVTRNRVRQKALLNRGYDDSPGKTAPAVADVEDHTPFAACDHSGVHFSRRIDLVTKTRITMGVNVARTKFLGQQDLDRPFWPIGAKVHHHGNVCYRSSLYGILHRLPLRAREVSRFYAYNHLGILLRHLGCRRWLHVGQVIFVLRPAHARSHYVDEGEHPGFRTINDVLLEVFEILIPGGPGVRNRSHSTSECEVIRPYAVVA